MPLTVPVAARRLCGLLSACLGSLTLFGALPNAAVAASLPYSDPNASGYVGLCAKDGTAVTSGELSTAPFVWNAVSSVAAPAPYNVSGATATLYAYQPRANVPSAEWSGEQLTAASRFSNPAAPMTAATAADLSLRDFVLDYPPQLDGLIQLRIYLGAPNEPTRSNQYAATDIKVAGDTWQVVDGGPADCTRGKSVSVETLLLPSSDLTARNSASATGPEGPPAASGASSAGSSSPAPNATGPLAPSGTSTSVGAVSPSVADSQAAAEIHARTRSAASAPVWITVCAVALVAIGAGGYLIGRRRRTE